MLIELIISFQIKSNQKNIRQTNEKVFWGKKVGSIKEIRSDKYEVGVMWILAGVEINLGAYLCMPRSLLSLSCKLLYFLIYRWSRAIGS
jgi:hypothetical protein